MMTDSTEKRSLINRWELHWRTSLMRSPIGSMRLMLSIAKKSMIYTEGVTMST